MVKLPKSEVMSVKTNFVERYHRLENELAQFSVQLNSVSPYHMKRVEALEERRRITASLGDMKHLSDMTDESDDSRWE